MFTVIKIFPNNIIKTYGNQLFYDYSTVDHFTEKYLLLVLALSWNHLLIDQGNNLVFQVYHRIRMKCTLFGVFFFFWQSSLHSLNWEHSECLSAEISLLGCVRENLKVSYCSQVKIYKKCFGSAFHKNFQDSTIQFHSCTISISSRGIWTQNFKVSKLFQNGSATASWQGLWTFIWNCISKNRFASGITISWK